MFSKSETETRAAFTTEESNALNAATEAATKARANWTVASEKVDRLKREMREGFRRQPWEVAALHRDLEAAQQELDEATAAIGPAQEQLKSVQRETSARARARFAPMQAALFEDENGAAKLDHRAAE